MKKYLLVVGVLLLGSALYADDDYRPYKEVVVRDTGPRGHVLVSEGYDYNRGHTWGTWKDDEYFKGEKGDKGDKGDQGERGLTGRAGRDGVDGTDGKDGKDGLDGVDGVDGIRGMKGEKGDRGANGEDADMTKVTANATAIRSQQAQIRSNTDAIHELSETKYVIEGDLRLLDTKRASVHLFGNYDVRHRKGHEVGVRVGFKLGKSYEERLIEVLQREIIALKAVAHKPGRHQHLHFTK